MANRIEKERVDLIYDIIDNLLRRELPYGSTGEERRNTVTVTQSGRNPSNNSVDYSVEIKHAAEESTATLINFATLLKIESELMKKAGGVMLDMVLAMEGAITLHLTERPDLAPKRR
jgi:hypothetical protein